MPIFRLDNRFIFPDPDLADDNGLLAVGGDLKPQRVIAAYKLGIFPWPCEGCPLMWHSPKERFVLDPQQLQVNRTLEKVLRHHPFEVRLDTAFHDVMLRCADTPRPGQDGTWITDEMLASYTQLHQMGIAHSAESWHDGQLVGGLYGIALGRAFFGESMFALRANASKVAFATLVRQLARWQFVVVDCQVETPLLASFGAAHIPRQVFSQLIAHAVAQPNRPSPWQFDDKATAGDHS